MASHPARPQLGLFDNPVRVFSLDELAETVRKLERERPGRTVEELSGAVFSELAIEKTRRAANLVAEAIRLARPRQPGTEITGSRWQAGTSEVRKWALSAGFELGADGSIPGPAPSPHTTRYIPIVPTELTVPGSWCYRSRLRHVPSDARGSRAHLQIPSA